MRIATFDPIGGAAGDMILAALIDAGLPALRLRRLVRDLGLPGVKLRVRQEHRRGIQVRRLDVVLPKGGRQKATKLREVLARLEKAKIAGDVRKGAARIFRRLAEAEAVVHGTTVGRVHLHEAGARDALVDVVGAVFGLKSLGVERVHCAPLPLGEGHVHASHGAIPLPAPATVELLRGREVRLTGEPGEHTTPTGAAILSTLVERFGPPPPFVLGETGYGAGARDDGVKPNWLRVFIGETSGGAGEEVWLLETGIDDMNPEHYTHLFGVLHEAGALEVSVTPTFMKKNRPGTLLRVVCAPDRVAAVEEKILRETTTFGVRRVRAERTCLGRETRKVRTRYGTVRVKLGMIGGEVVTRSPEYEDCRKAAARSGATLKAIYEAAMRALDRRSD